MPVIYLFCLGQQVKDCPVTFLSISPQCIVLIFVVYFKSCVLLIADDDVPRKPKERKDYLMQHLQYCECDLVLNLGLGNKDLNQQNQKCTTQY